jgi:hypothetical protein
MIRRMMPGVLLLCLGSLSPGSLAAALAAALDRYSASPRIEATVLTLEPRRLATIQTSDGVRYEVLRGTGWQVGDPIVCEHNVTGGPAWRALECQKSS